MSQAPRWGKQYIAIPGYITANISENSPNQAIFHPLMESHEYRLIWRNNLDFIKYFAIFDDMKIIDSMPHAAIIQELGRRAQQRRVSLNLPQARLAEVSGVSARTIERFETGSSIQLDKLVPILRALQLCDALDLLIPDDAIRPLQLADNKAEYRQRAYTKGRSSSPRKENWVWGDEK